MTVDKSWKLGDPSRVIYKLYDRIRRQLNHHLVAYLCQYLGSDQNNIALEAGCGTGYAAALMGAAANVRLSIALDYDIEALHTGKQRDPLLPAVVANLTALPFRAESIDLVWNSSTLEHLPDARPALIEMRRVARPHGHVFVGVPYANGPLGFQRWIARTGAGIWIGTVFSRMRLDALLRQAGLRSSDSMTYFLRFFIGIMAVKG
jgi:ubiquinone/menaquinone biosynthesis C-methylase UbiE